MPEQPLSRTPAEGLRQYMPTLRRRWRLALGIVLVAAFAGFAAAAMSPKSHEATAKVLLDQQREVDALMGTSEFSNDPERDLNTGIQLITLEPIANRVRRTLGLAEPSSMLVAQVSTKIDRNSNIVSITVRDASAARAALIANAFAAGYRDFRTQSARAAVDDAIASAQARLRRLAPGAERTALTTELRRLQVAGAFQTGGVQVVHPATAAAATTRPRPLLSAVIGAMLGVLLAAVVVVVLARTDTRVRSEGELEVAAGRPILARVPADADGALDAMMTLALSLPLSRSGGAGPTVLLLTSPGRGEGTGDVALGLVDAFDAIGEIAIAVETDLREPAFAATLGVDERGGLVAVLRDSVAIDGELVFMDGACALPAGPAQPLPQALLASERMGSLVEELRSDADVVVLAGAPVGVVGDSLALVGFVDEVVLVACPGVTRVDDMQRAVEALKAAGSSPVGVVTTSVPKRRLLRATLDRLHAMSRLRGSTKQAAAEQAPGAAGTTTEVPVA